MDAKDVLGDSCEQMLAAANSKRHAELITRLKELVKGLDEGRFVASAPADADAAGAEISAEDVGDAELPATLTDDQVEEILAPLRLAMESKSPKVIRAALAALQRLIAHGMLSGDADLRDEDAGGADASSAPAVSSASAAASASASSAAAAPAPDGADVDAETVADVASSDPAASSESTQPSKPPPPRTPNGGAFESTPLPPPTPPLAPLSRRERHCGEAVALICAGAEIVDERCELECLKGLLAAVSSRSFRVHGRALLRVVRTCYNVHLGSKSEVNQATAKASLTQMLTVVFHRLETDDPSTLPPPIVVADLLGKNDLATHTKSATSDDSFENLAGYVQGLLNKAIADTNASIAGIAVAVGAVEPDDGCVDETRGKNEVTSREFDEESEPATPKSNVSVRSGSVTPRHSVGEGTDRSRAVLSARKTLENDAFLVFRALCKLAKKAGDLTVPAVLRGKTLSLELLKILLANAGPVFASTRRFVDATKEYVCDAVVTNAAPGVPVAYQLSLSIFLTLLEKFRSALKPEIGYFYPLLMLKPLEVVIGAPLAPYTQRQILLQCHRKLCGDAQLLVDLFVNYDCDLDSSNLFERTVNSVVRVAQGLPGVAEQTGQELARESMLAADALGCITKLLETLGGWVDDKLGVGAAADAAAKARKLAASRTEEGEDDGEEANPGGGNESAVVGIERAKASKAEYQRAIALFNKKPKKGVALMQKIGRLGETPEEIAAFLRHTPDLDKTVIGDYLGERDEPMLSVMHAYVDAMDFTDQTLDEGIRKFLEGFRLPGESQKIDRLMEKFAERFCKQNPGEYKSADTAYVLAFSVIMLNTDAHNPQVKNKMTKEGFLRNNRGIDDGADLPKEHLENLYDRIVNNEIRMKDEDPELLAQKAEMNAKDGASSFNRTMKDMSNRLGMDVLSQMMFGATKREQMVDASGFMEEVRERAKRDNGRFQTATDPSCVRPMLDVAWPAMLAVFSMSFEVSEAPATVDAALAGFSRMIHLTCVTGMTETRDAFVLPLANLTSLHSPGALRGKNVVAMRELLKVGMDNANTLGGAWTHCLKAVSRYDRLYNYAMGFDDVSLFTDEMSNGDRGGEGLGGGDGGGKRGGASRLFRKSGKGLGSGGRFGSPAVITGQGGAKAPSPSSSSSGLGGLSFMMPTTSMSGMFGGGSGDESPFAHLKKASVNKKTENGAPTGVASSPSSAPPPEPEPEPPVDKFLLHDLEFEPPPKEILEALTPDDASVVFGSTDQLDSEAVIEFVRALCEVAREELGARSPRVFSLAKLVEIAVMNMSIRPRIIWSRMWSVLADFFAEVGCHSNLRIAQYVVDSLRQLAMKFLERGELANYSFQNEFLRPFVVLMRQSDAPEIRELIIRCTSQMVSGHVDNVKSGWKSMFMIFTAAANDEERAVVQLAFETIERIIRDQFEHITETDATTFTDCVNCLIAFTNSPTAPEEVCLNAIAFLRFCALKLADGSLGKLELAQLGDDAADDTDGAFNTPPGSPDHRDSSRSPKKPRERERGATDFTDAELDLSYWFPLLAGLSELTFDARRDIRRSALEVLFDILKFHGDHFSPGFWARVYESILMPVFDHVRAEVCDADVQTASPFVQQSPHSPPSAGKPPAHPRHKPPPWDRNAEADAWLYQTCQHCLELVVDLTAQFYPAVTQSPDILPKFLALLSGLAVKNHEALAACGIGALSRLLLGAGHRFDENAWTIAIDALADAMNKTAPDAKGLVKENASGDMVPSASNGVKVEMTAEMEAAVVLGTHPSAWLRASGTCACHASTQRLLVSAAAEAYFRHGRRMSAGRLETLTSALERCAAHAADVNGDGELCGRLARATAAAAMAVAERPSLLDAVGSYGSHGSGSGSTGRGGVVGAFRFLPDPPLVALEVEASQAALAVLLHLHTAGEEPGSASGGTKGVGDDASQSDAQAAAAAASRHRLAGLAMRILRDFARLASGEGGEAHVVAQARDEINARAPLAVDALKALARFSDDLFAEKVGEAFPALTALVRCEHAPAEVSRVLGEVFTAKIGPLVIGSLGKSRRRG